MSSAGRHNCFKRPAAPVSDRSPVFVQARFREFQNTYGKVRRSRSCHSRLMVSSGKRRRASGNRPRFPDLSTRLTETVPAVAFMAPVSALISNPRKRDRIQRALNGPERPIQKAMKFLDFQEKRLARVYGFTVHLKA
jgi:hypothetical protein